MTQLLMPPQEIQGRSTQVLDHHLLGMPPPLGIVESAAPADADGNLMHEMMILFLLIAMAMAIGAVVVALGIFLTV